MTVSRTPHPLASRVTLLLAGIGIVLDQATKVVAERLLTTGVYVPLLGDGVGWQLVHNPGASFGLPVPPPVFLATAVLVVVIVMRSMRSTRTLTQASAYGLLLAGALGNLVDRFLRAEDGIMSGRVVDFVAWGSFPRFNVADACITVGFVLLVATLWHEDRRDAAEAGEVAGDGAGEVAGDGAGEVAGDGAGEVADGVDGAGDVEP